ncbi:hypothetical protein K1T35_14315 [Pseudonocardia sp. DSM 110487]|nr:hypothetical protein K1T35_14315 [Pseudonocardia sp. DSM 110487]
MRSYATLALRIDRHLDGTALIYDGPAEWRAAVAAEEPVPPATLADECEALRQDIPVDGERGTFLAAQLTAMHATARRLTDEGIPFAEHARRCLGVPIEPTPEDLLADAHSRLATALPPGSGSLAEQLHAWQQTHMVPADHVPELVRRAMAETVARTRAIVALPGEIHLDVRLDAGPHRGHYAGGNRGTLHVSDAQPFNGADLLSVVAHEGFPGHEAQHWLAAELGIAVDGDLAAIHDARNALWGAWGNAALLTDAGRPDAEVADHLTRWALLTDAETAWALDFLRSPAMRTYVLGYVHGWQLLRRWLDHPDRNARVRRLLTEPVLPADLV